MCPLTSDQPLLVLKIRKEKRECHHLFKNTRMPMLPSHLQTHHAERRRRTSPAWICRGCGRTSSDPENWSLSRRIWSPGWCYTREGGPQHFLDLEPLQPLLHHPQILCPTNRRKTWSASPRRDQYHPFSAPQALLPVFILYQLCNE